jgi:DNA-binding MarR family transcriptional regulator
MTPPREHDSTARPTRAAVLAALDAMDGDGRIAPSVFTADELAAHLGAPSAAVERTLERLRRERRVERLELGPGSRAWKRWAGYREVRSPG